MSFKESRESNSVKVHEEIIGGDRMELGGVSEQTPIYTLELPNHDDYLSLINSISRDIVCSLTIEEIVWRVHSNLKCLMDQVIIAIGISNRGSNTLDFYGISDDMKTTRFGQVPLDWQKVWPVKCFSENREILFDSEPKDADYQFSRVLFGHIDVPRKSFIYIPLCNRMEVLGVLTVQSFNDNAFSQQHLLVIRNMAHYLAVAIDNARAYRKIEKQKEEIQLTNQALLAQQEHLEELVQERTKEIMKQQHLLMEQAKKLEMLSIVAEKTENAIMIMDQVGNVLWINDFFTRIYGYNFDEFIGARGSNIRQTSFNPEINSMLDRCILTKKPVYYEAPNITKGKRTKWTHTSLTPVLNSKREITHLVTIDTDITERKEYEQKIVKYSKEVTESIQYARRIQNAMLPPKAMVRDLLPEHFVLFRPKGIVSGDFYWVEQIDSRIIIAAADCTGHGVPGAFMSMLGISLLNEIVNKFTINSASDVLNHLRRLVKQSLHQEAGRSLARDGMDISLCIIDPTRNYLQFAGAYNPLVVANSGGVRVFKGDRMPIGIHPKEKATFTNHSIEYSPDDTFYILTDGLTSVFGGPNYTKFKMSQFLELIHGCHSLPLQQQKELIVKEMECWLGSNEQIDDTLVMGFRIG